jgi:hypothetical protein
MAFQDNMNHEQWADIYKKLVFWELQMDHKDNEEMGDVLDMQKTEANTNFARFIMRNYEGWLNDPRRTTPSFAPVMKENFSGVRKEISLRYSC